MNLPGFFSDFLSEIRPTDSQLDDAKTGHETLRKRLKEDEALADVIVSDFLQGSYRRATAIRPTGDQRSDVDVIVVTNLDSSSYTPEEALQQFVPFVEKHYKGKYHLQSRSIAIELSYVDLDLVVTAAPSEAQKSMLLSDAVKADVTPEDVNDWRLVKDWVEPQKRAQLGWYRIAEALKREAEWKSEPLLIPDRDLKTWEKTHPLAQIQWTWDKNRKTNSYYVNVVKAIKWWHRYCHAECKYPKGYPLEHIIGYCCPDGIDSVADGVTLTFESIVSSFSTKAALKQTPFLANHGIPDQNVLHRLSGDDFSAFYDRCKTAAGIAREALDETDKVKSAQLWRKLFGPKFPEPEDEGTDSLGGQSSGGFTPRTEATVVSGGRFA